MYMDTNFLSLTWADCLEKMETSWPCTQILLIQKFEIVSISQTAMILRSIMWKAVASVV